MEFKIKLTNITREDRGGPLELSEDAIDSGKLNTGETRTSVVSERDEERERKRERVRGKQM